MTVRKSARPKCTSNRYRRLRLRSVASRQIATLAALLIVGCGSPDGEMSRVVSPRERVESPREIVVPDAVPLWSGDHAVMAGEGIEAWSLGSVFSAYDVDGPTRLVSFEETVNKVEGDASPATVELDTDDETALLQEDTKNELAEQGEDVSDNEVAGDESQSDETHGDDEPHGEDKSHGDDETSGDGEAPRDDEVSDGDLDSPATDNSDSTEAGETPLAADDDEDALKYPNWPKPELVFFATGRQHGYIEPCGCSGLDKVKGGLSRRHTLLMNLRDKFGTVTAVDVGDQVRRFGRQAELKFQATVDSMEKMKYQGIGIGPADLKISTGDLISAFAGSDPDNSPFVCANVSLLGFPRTHRVVRVGRRRIGITAIMGAEHTANLNDSDLETRSPEDGLRDALAELKKEKCELIVLLSHASLNETRELVRKFPKIQVVITAGGAGEPTLEPERVPGCFAYIIQVGTKGTYGGVVGIFMDPKNPVRYERIPLSARFSDSRLMLDRFKAYQNDLEQHGFRELRVRPVAHPFDANRKYIGHEACADCHADEVEIFNDTPHAHATQSIIEPPNDRSEITRIHDPECVSCHVTGWDAQGYTPYVGGFIDVEKSKHLHGNGCENCHGPGSRHADFENGLIDVPADQFDVVEAAYRKEMRLTLEEAKTTKCFECHDVDNSPAFQKDGAFEEYWEPIKH